MVDIQYYTEEGKNDEGSVLLDNEGRQRANMKLESRVSICDKVDGD